MGTLRKDKTAKALLFLAPSLILYTLFTAIPIFYGVYISLHNWTLLRKVSFIGLDHYTHMVQDPYVWSSLKNSTLFVLLSTPTLLIAAFLLALVCNQSSRLKKLYRMTFFFPSVLTVSIVSTLTLFMVQPYLGFVNMALKDMALLAQSDEIFWLRDVKSAWLIITLLTVWWTVGFNMMLYLSGLQGIPDQLYEAATIDGAGPLLSLRKITIPMLMPLTRILVLLQTIASYKVFAQIFLTTEGKPARKTMPIIQYIYEVGFIENNLGYAATISYLLFFILLGLSIVHYRINMREGSGV